MHNRIQPKPNEYRERLIAVFERQATAAERSATALEYLTRLFQEFAGAYLNARFTYGKAADRWRRRP